MSCYLIEHDFEKSYSLTMDVEDLSSKMPSYSQRYRAKARLKSWIAPKASFYAGGNYIGVSASIPDVTTWALGNLVLSPKAFQVFKDDLDPVGEFLPLLIGSETYYMFNTLFVIPESAIDLTGAFDVVNSGVHMGQDQVKFDESQLVGCCLFKSPTNKLTYSFATEEFKSKYDKYGFTGLMFKKVS